MGVCESQREADEMTADDDAVTALLALLFMGLAAYEAHPPRLHMKPLTMRCSISCCVLGSHSGRRPQTKRKATNLHRQPKGYPALPQLRSAEYFGTNHSFIISALSDQHFLPNISETFNEYSSSQQSALARPRVSSPSSFAPRSCCCDAGRRRPPPMQSAAQRLSRLRQRAQTEK